MVRFIIRLGSEISQGINAFTFQYGQIYYAFALQLYAEMNAIYIPIWLDLLFLYMLLVLLLVANLHSNMVRFIMNRLMAAGDGAEAFTFQYGQIYYEAEQKWFRTKKAIYIPIWLDLLLLKLYNIYKKDINLHSNMVRFIITRYCMKIIIYQ